MGRAGPGVEGRRGVARNWRLASSGFQAGHRFGQAEGGTSGADDTRGLFVGSCARRGGVGAGPRGSRFRRGGERRGRFSGEAQGPDGRAAVSRAGWMVAAILGGSALVEPRTCEGQVLGRTESGSTRVGGGPRTAPAPRPGWDMSRHGLPAAGWPVGEVPIGGGRDTRGTLGLPFQSRGNPPRGRCAQGSDPGLAGSAVRVRVLLARAGVLRSSSVAVLALRQE